MLPHDLTAEFRAIQRAHRRCRVLAYIGLSLFATLIGISLGSLVSNGASVVLIILITAWGTWSLNYLLTNS